MKKLTQAKLKELFDYNPITGDFINKTERWYNSKRGSVVGYLNSAGYLITRISSKKYPVHRLAFLYMEGYFPENPIDHIDRNKSNNKWENLREVSRQCNSRNSGNYKHNTSGVKGVYWNSINKKWVVSIVINLKRYYVGVYKNFSEAVCVRLAVEQCIGWSGCDNSSPAYKYVQKMLNGEC